MILRDKIFSGFSVKDIDEAFDFYKNKLGLEVEKNEMSILTLKINERMNVIIYPKGDDHTPATFTVLNFPVTNIDDAVEELEKKGITFLQYDTEYIQTDAKGIARGTEGPAIAWFTDPSGNILSILEE